MEEVQLKDQYFDHKQVDSTGCFRRHSTKLKRYRDNFTEITLAHNAVDTPLSGNNEATEVTMPSPKKSRKGIKKRAISVPISECDGSRSKGEVYPPSDSWSWRKYGQKPIKGSPYPRGYYKCSSSKGCPARKQVERSHHDPTMLLITYSSDHNHTLPPAASKHRHPTTPTSIPTTTPASTDTNNSPAATPEDEVAVFTYQPNNDFPEIPEELGWFSDVGSTLMESTSLVGSTWIDNDAAVMLPIGEEDKSLFGDLGELPECSVVFRRYSVDSPCTD